jgi:hypothetical protein
LSTIYTVPVLLVAREVGQDMLGEMELKLELGTNQAIFFASTSLDTVGVVSPGSLFGVVGTTRAGVSLA